MMETTILGSEQAVRARKDREISQGKAANDLGINRSYLSQFESGKRLLSDAELTAMREYYESLGYVFEDSPTIEANGVTTMDGFVVPNAMSHEEADELLTEYAENAEEIALLAESEISPESGIFANENALDEKDKASKTKRLLCLMAHQYTLIEKLHGREVLPPCDIDQGAEGLFTPAEFVSLELSQELNDETK